MNVEEAIALIQALADTLAVPAQQLLAYYMARIPALWVQFGVWLLSALVLFATLGCAVRTMRSRRVEWEQRQEIDPSARHVRPIYDPFMDGSAVAAIASMVSGMMLLVVVIVMLSTLQRAINATMAPEAYAIDAVLRHLRD